jgi:proton-dependent oligopeptide transporter, POT family
LGGLLQRARGSAQRMSIVILVGILVTVVTMIPVALQLRNHPKGLVVLFFAEMWERFSYYGMRGILIAYLTQHFLFERPFAGSIYGAYTSLVYLLPLIGGYLADKYLGTRKAIAFGALLLVAGHGLMAVEQKPAVQTLTYQSQVYQFESEGRIDQRKSWLVVDGKRYDYANKEGLRIISDAGATNPFGARLSSDAYKIDAREGGDVLVLGTDATGKDVYSISPAPEPSAADQTRTITGEGVMVRAQAAAWLEIEGLPAGASLPAIVERADYKIGATGQDPFYVNVLFFALALIAMGVGFLKANISTIVGQLYKEDDPRRDSGFTLYYYGINLGAFWAGIACVYFGMTVGWWLGFGLAGIGMALGFIVFLLGKGWLEGKGEPPEPQALKEPGFLGLNKETAIYLGGVLGVFAVFGLLWANGAARGVIDGWLEAANATKQAPNLFLQLADFFVVVGVVLVIGSVAVLGYIGNHMATRCTKIERDRLWLALILIAASVVFWTLFEQAGTSLNLFAQDTTDLRLFAGPVDLGFAYIATPAEYAAASFPAGQAPFWIDATFGAGNAQSFNSGFILFFAPVFAALWAFLESRKLDPNDPMKFALALVQVGAGFLVLVWGASFAGPDVRVPLLFLVLAYLLHTTGELFLSPVGLSMVTKLSPVAVGSTMMGVWFLSSAWSQWVGAVIAAMTATETIGGAVADSPASRQIALDAYLGVFNTIGWVAIGIGVVLGLLSFWLNRLAHREH